MSGPFSLAIGKFIKTCDMKAASVIQGVVQTLGQDVVMATPRDTGLLRGAWQIGINQVPTGTPMRIDPGGLSTLQSINGDSLAIKAGDTVYLVNNTVYANMVEFGGWRPPQFTPGMPHKYKGDKAPRVRTTPEGFSLQAPAGMARIAVARLQATFDARVAEWSAKAGGA
jgi:hypothetical protein